MKLSELKYAIREMIVSELMENTIEVNADQLATVKSKVGKDDIIRIIPEEEQLNEFAAFYKIKDDVDQEEAKAAIDKIKLTTEKNISKTY